nr:MAG TPA: hypothetical protein [Caudoviricetes sp.]
MSRWQRFCAMLANAGRAIVGGVSTVVAGAGPREVMLLGGCGLLGYGLNAVYPPAAFIIPGAIFVAVATIGSR